MCAINQSFNCVLETPVCGKPSPVGGAVAPVGGRGASVSEADPAPWALRILLVELCLRAARALPRADMSGAGPKLLRDDGCERPVKKKGASPLWRKVASNRNEIWWARVR